MLEGDEGGGTESVVVDRGFLEQFRGDDLEAVGED